MDYQTKCYKCFRPIKSCYCAGIVPVNTGVKFVYLMHPKEAYRQKTGTGRLASLTLNDSEIIIGVDFTYDKRLNALLSGEGDYAQYFPVVLYPSKNSYFTDSPHIRDNLKEKKLLVIVIDATWHLAKKMMRLSTNLNHLPKISFKKEYRSQFHIKVQPDPAYLATIESSYYLIEELKNAGIVNPNVDQSGLLNVFHKMVAFQQLCTQVRNEAEALMLGYKI